MVLNDLGFGPSASLGLFLDRTTSQRGFTSCFRKQYPTLHGLYSCPLMAWELSDDPAKEVFSSSSTLTQTRGQESNYWLLRMCPVISCNFQYFLETLPSTKPKQLNLRLCPMWGWGSCNWRPWDNASIHGMHLWPKFVWFFGGVALSTGSHVHLMNWANMRSTSGQRKYKRSTQKQLLSGVFRIMLPLLQVSCGKVKWRSWFKTCSAMQPWAGRHYNTAQSQSERA